MPASISLYNHTTKIFADGSNAVLDTYKVMLCTAATFDATNTTLASVSKTEVANGNGYTTGGQALSGVSVSTIATNDAKFSALDLIWSATPGAITASYGILYNDTDTNDPPLAFIDFGGSKTADPGTDFLIAWDVNGIFTWTTT